MKSIIAKLTIILTLLMGVSITNPKIAEGATGRGYRTSYKTVTPSRNSVGFVAGSTYGFGIGFTGGITGAHSFRSDLLLCMKLIDG